MSKWWRNAGWMVSVFALAAATSGLGAAEEARVLQASRTNTPPVIDGRLDEPDWAKGEKAVDFSTFNQAKNMAKDQTTGRVLFDDENIYVGLECLESRMDLLKKDLEGMGPAFDYNKGEVIEVFLNADPGGIDYIHFLIGTNAGRVSSIPGVMGIAQLPYKAAVSLGKDRFFVEVAIPLSILHLGPQTKPTWGFNLNRARSMRLEELGGLNARYSSWNNTLGAFNRPQYFGRLKIDLDTRRYWYDVAIVKGPPDTLAKTEVKVVNRTGQPAKLKATLGFTSGDREKTWDKAVSLNKGEEKVVTFEGPFPNWTREAVLSLTLSDAGTKRTLYYGGTRSVDVTPRHKGPIPNYSQEDVADGYVLFTKDYTTRAVRTYMPSAAEVNRPAEICASGGEYEPCVLGIRTFRKLTGVRMHMEGDLASGDGDKIGTGNIDLRIITETKYWTPQGRGQEFRWQPRRAESKLPDELAAGQTYFYWITLKVPKDAPAGRYSGRLVFSTNGIRPRKVPLNVTIWPIKLQQPTDMCWGYYYDIARLPAYARNLAYQKKIFENLAEYGQNNTTIYGGVSREEGNWRIEKCNDPYLPLLQTMNDALTAGAITRGIPVMTLGTTITTKVVNEAAAKYDWPPLLQYAYDEPGSDERIAIAKKGLAQIKKANPDVKLVTAISEHGLKALGDFYDVWVVGSGSLAAPVVAKGRAKGKLIWTYDCGKHTCNFQFNRYFTGLYSWKTKVKGNWQWALIDLPGAHRTGRPLNEVYHRNREKLWELFLNHPEEFNFTFNYLFPARDGLIPALGHIARREGVDDYRYIYTLTQWIDKAAADKNPKAQIAAAKSQKVLNSIFSKVSMNPWAKDVYPYEEMRKKGILPILGDWQPDSHIRPEQYNSFRKRIAGQIVILQELLAP